MAGYYAPDTNRRAADWRDDAACREEDPETWFPIGTTGEALLQIEEAKAVCRRCPVMEACGEWALTTRQDAGVWGGMSEAERRSIRKRRGRAPRPLAPCGTDAAYRRHIKRGEEVHPECLAAHNAAQLVHYHANKATA